MFYNTMGKVPRTLGRTLKIPFIIACVIILVLLALSYQNLYTRKIPTKINEESNRLLYRNILVENEKVTTTALSTNRQITSLIDIPTNFGFDHPPNDSKYTILWYNPAGWLKDRNKKLDMDSCDYNNCRFTENRTFLHNASALIFGISSEDIGKYPPISRRKRNPDQVWIHHSREAPVYHGSFTEYKTSAWRDVMNWSMNFNFDADVFSPYGKIVTKRVVKKRDYDMLYDQKNKTALWLVSYCGSMSNRYKYVKALQKAGLDVDVYGFCEKKEYYTGSIKNLMAPYKFYLSMENSYCKYYVTEKVFDRFNDDVISVIRGGANYDQLLPSGTFIDANKFSNASQLAKHLNELGSDRKRYIDILREKDKYDALNEYTFGHQYALCDVCRKLNTFNSQRKTYTYLANEVLKEGRCMQPDEILIK